MIMTAKSHNISVNGAEKIPSEYFILDFTVSKGARLCRFSRM